MTAGQDAKPERSPRAAPPRRLSVAEWETRYHELAGAGLQEPPYGGPLSRHLAEGDRRLSHLRFDDSPAALRLWNFLLSEDDRLAAARRQGILLVGTMKDLGTVPVLVDALDEVRAFYPDGAWWIPCIMEMREGTLQVADRLGIDESFCPVRAMLGAFMTGAHFPIPELLICSTGAVCDDFSAIAQRLERLGHPIFWWEIPARRPPDPGEEARELSCGLVAPERQVALVRGELDRIRRRLEQATGERLTDTRLQQSIAATNRVRTMLCALRNRVYGAGIAPLPALEMLVAEMLIIHYCSDRPETEAVLGDLLEEVERREHARVGVSAADAVRLFWINPVADLRALLSVEDLGARLCGTDYLFGHAIDPIPAGRSPLDALALAALADPMVGSSAERAARIVLEARERRAEAVVISRIPGASHCALEGTMIARTVERELGCPVVEIEVPPVSDSLETAIRTRLEALVETARGRRGR